MNVSSSSKLTHTLIRVGVIVALVATLFMLQSSTIQADYAPWISVSAVVANANVTIELYNLPQNTDFSVQMGKSGTGGVGGYYSAGFSTGTETYSAKNFEIPVALYDEALIDVRIVGGGIAVSTSFYNTGTVSDDPTPGIVYAPIPTTSIKSVEVGESVTVTTYNFPAEKDFVAYMGEYGTRGVGGIDVGTFYSASGGSFELTFDIPESLADEHMIAIRLQTPDNHWYAYDWFYNQPSVPVVEETEAETVEAAPDPNAGYTGFPLTTIVSNVDKVSVEVKVTNLPKGIDFAVTIGAFGTRGVGGVKVDEFNSADGGTQTFTFDVPAAYAESHKLAIRLDSGRWYAYDWWVNSPVAVESSTTTATTTTMVPSNIPSTSFVVKEGGMVKFMAYNFEPDTEWIVKMGPFGTRGVDGVYIQSLTSVDGAFSIWSEIPASLADLDKIAIRFEQVDGPYYAYDWFNN